MNSAYWENKIMRKYTKNILCIVCVVLFLPCITQALSLVNTTWKSDMAIRFTSELFGKVTPTWTGPFTTQLRDDQGNLVNNGEWFPAFCVDPYQGAQTGGELAVQSLNPSSVQGGLQAAWLFDTYYNETATAAQLAGIQLAIWEVVVDDANNGGYSLAAGNFKVTAGNTEARNFASSYLASLPGSFDAANLNSSYFIAHHNTAQDLIIKDPRTPEPATILLLGAGILGIAASVRRQRNK
jgi:hypothetical protein